jgi:hypothetical protein
MIDSTVTSGFLRSFLADVLCCESFQSHTHMLYYTQTVSLSISPVIMCIKLSPYHHLIYRVLITFTFALTAEVDFDNFALVITCSSVL